MSILAIIEEATVAAELTPLLERFDPKYKLCTSVIEAIELCESRKIDPMLVVWHFRGKGLTHPEMSALTERQYPFHFHRRGLKTAGTTPRRAARRLYRGNRSGRKGHGAGRRGA